MSGTKVTTDPQSLNDPKYENPGLVTSDSLAGESINQGGSFAANSSSRGVVDQPSSGLTANTTDDSNARRLDPAPNAEARLASEEWGENAALKAGSQLGKSSDDGRGPTYAGVSASTNESSDRPKGKNLHEGGFDSGAPNASFNTDIGGKKDPGRVALEQMEASNVPSAGGAGPRQNQVTDDGQYDTLGETSA